MKHFYNLVAAPLMLTGYRLYALVNQKAREYFRIREGMYENLDRALSGRAEKNGRVIFHVASVGELLQAMPVMAELMNMETGPQVVLSYTSPSVAGNMPKGVPADVITPSPIDVSSHVKKFLDLLAPDLVIFSTYDLWPGFVQQTLDRGIPGVLINAALPENSGRLKAPARLLFSSLYPRLSAVGAITREDADRFSRLGVPRQKVHLTGNCRFDQTIERCRRVTDDDPDLSALPEADLMLIAGSTWPEDHERLLPALAAVLEDVPAFKAAIAPHEPGPDHVREVEEFFNRRKITTARYTDLREGSGDKDARVIVVNTVGVLFKLYKRGRMAYVGGGFGRGVHNVMEPAGMGLPVMVGPRHQNSAEALRMINSGGVVCLKSAAGIETVVKKWISDPAARQTAGKRARDVVLQNAGAAGRTTALVREFLPGQGAPRQA